MKAEALQRELDAVLPHGDMRASHAVCNAFRVLRDFLDKHLSGGAVGGFFFRLLFPKTHEGIQAVIKLLDDYLQSQCGLAR